MEDDVPYGSVRPTLPTAISAYIPPRSLRVKIKSAALTSSKWQAVYSITVRPIGAMLLASFAQLTLLLSRNGHGPGFCQAREYVRTLNHCTRSDIRMGMCGGTKYRSIADANAHLDMQTNRHVYFRWTPRTARVTFMYVVVVPVILGTIAYKTDVSLLPEPAWSVRHPIDWCFRVSGTSERSARATC